MIQHIFTQVELLSLFLIFARCQYTVNHTESSKGEETNVFV